MWVLFVCMWRHCSPFCVTLHRNGQPPAALGGRALLLSTAAAPIMLGWDKSSGWACKLLPSSIPLQPAALWGCVCFPSPCYHTFLPFSPICPRDPALSWTYLLCGFGSLSALDSSNNFRGIYTHWWRTGLEEGERAVPEENTSEIQQLQRRQRVLSGRDESFRNPQIYHSKGCTSFLDPC